MSGGQRIAEALLIAGGVGFLALIVIYPLPMLTLLGVSFVGSSLIGSWLRRINERQQ